MQKPACSCSVQSGQKEKTLIVDSHVDCDTEGFKFNQNDVWDMKINAFMKAVQRVSHIKNADLLLGSGYSGFGVDLKKINKKQLNYFDGLSV